MNSSSSKKPTKDDSSPLSTPFLPPAEPSTTADEQVTLDAFHHLLARYRRVSYEWLEHQRQARLYKPMKPDQHNQH